MRVVSFNAFTIKYFYEREIIYKIWFIHIYIFGALSVLGNSDSQKCKNLFDRAPGAFATVNQTRNTAEKAITRIYTVSRIDLKD